MNTVETGFTWRSQPVFVIVSVGAILSLNDFLTFPVLAGQNGGGAFLLLYILFLFTFSLPLLMTELMMGRMTRSDPTRSFAFLTREYRLSIYWRLVGLGAMFAALLIIATFSVIAGWSFAYSVKSTAGVFDGATLETARLVFNEFIIDSERMALWQTLFMIVLVSVCAQSVKDGLQRITLILVPVMFLLLSIGLVLALTSSDMEQSIRFTLYADFAGMDSRTPLLALQRAFYTLAIGLGVMVAYGRYLPAGLSIGYSAGLVITVDLLFSLFAGLAINALLLSSGQQPGVDSQFAFRVMPVILGQFDYGGIYAALFFLLLTIAALTSSAALMEGPITFLQNRQGISRLRATIVIAIGIWLFGLGIVLAHSLWQGEGFTLALFYGDEAIRMVNNAGFDDVLIFIASHLIQPFVALLTCWFVAWYIPREVTHKELSLRGQFRFEVWNYLVRYIVPVLLVVVILTALGII
jgi:NSS family neurotransmitter:Na+ symporter